MPAFAGMTKNFVFRYDLYFPTSGKFIINKATCFIKKKSADVGDLREPVSAVHDYNIAYLGQKSSTLVIPLRRKAATTESRLICKSSYYLDSGVKRRNDELMQASL